MRTKRYDPFRHGRRSIRLPGHDYAAPGLYYVTICTQGRECLFGSVIEGSVVLNDCGQIAQQCWNELPHHYPNVVLDAFVVMPNHVHGVVVLKGDGGRVGVGLNPDGGVGAGFKPAPTLRRHALPEIVRGFKTFSSRRINKLRDLEGNPVWQRNYYEHIVRDEGELARIRQYVADNPKHWDEDEYHRE
jgi:REP element-mobilizing transposase RayT